VRFARVAAAGGWRAELDVRQSAQGRGAYACPDEACVHRALLKGGVARTLRFPVDPKEAERLLERAVEYLRERTLQGAPPRAHGPAGGPRRGPAPGEEI
jgi:predicted RNA-binding protein YlxR (DUF448 family)